MTPKEPDMRELLRTDDVTEEIKQFWTAMETLGGFLQMMQPQRTKKTCIARCRLYSKIFNICMEHLDEEYRSLT